VADYLLIIATFAVGTPRAEGEGEIARVQFVSLSPHKKRSLCRGHLDRRSVVNGNIFNSKGVRVGVVMDDAVFGLKGQKLYDLKGSNIYKLNGDLVGHLSDARGAEKRLDKATDKLFPST
jgi:sporulation protein YlmC with PRC-barrel domain